MKYNYIKTVLTVMIFAAIIVSCEKSNMEVTEESEKVDNPSSIIIPDSLNFSIENSTIQFENEDEFNKCISFLASNGEENFEAFENAIEFQSFRSVCVKQNNMQTLKESDPLFLTLLNTDREIIIEGNLYQFDFENETVILCSADLKEKALASYSFDDDIFGILEGDEPLKGSYCNSARIGPKEKSFTCGTIEYEIRYFKAGIYYSLVAKINRKSAGCLYCMISTSKEYCWWKNKRTEGSSSASLSGYSDITLRPYSSTRRLKDYKFGAQYYVSDANNPGVYFTPSLTINCIK